MSHSFCGEGCEIRKRQIRHLQRTSALSIIQFYVSGWKTVFLWVYVQIYTEQHGWVVIFYFQITFVISRGR